MLESQSLSFGAFMQEWLYGEGANIFHTEGYYHSPRVGINGDFYTNVSVGVFFGYCLGYYLHTFLQENSPKGKIAIVEIGSERGCLIADIAEFFALYDKTYSIDFLILEPLLNLQKVQKETFSARKLPYSLKCVLDFTDLKECAYDCLLFVSNELLDAFPCELVYDSKMATIQIHSDKNVELFFVPAQKEILEFAESFEIQRGEIPLNSLTFVNNIAHSAKQWLFLSFDYGALHVRNEFSLRFYHNHTTTNLFSSPHSTQYNAQTLQNFAQTDITYDVNFALWKELFIKAGGDELFIKHQNRALVDMGLDRMCSWYIERFGLESYMQQSAKLRTLISPGAFGERFFGFAFANF